MASQSTNRARSDCSSRSRIRIAKRTTSISRRRLILGTEKSDFKFSYGFSSRILVEIKLSTNKKLVAGFQSQLEVYKCAEETMCAVYLVIDVGQMSKKDVASLAIQNEARKKKVPVSDLEFVDGRKMPSASKR